MTKQEYLNSYDELNNLVSASTSLFKTGEIDDDDFLDYVLTMLVMAYENGYNTTSEMTGLNVADLDIIKLEEALDKKVDGKTYEDRIRTYLKDVDNNEEEIARVVETEYHRIFNEGGFDRAKEIENEGYPIRKIWETMQDGKVRPTHEYLQNDGVELDEYFFTFDGDSALAPGGFAMAENNVGCRCWLEYHI